MSVPKKLVPSGEVARQERWPRSTLNLSKLSERLSISNVFLSRQDNPPNVPSKASRARRGPGARRSCQRGRRRGCS